MGRIIEGRFGAGGRKPDEPKEKAPPTERNTVNAPTTVPDTRTGRTEAKRSEGETRDLRILLRAIGRATEVTLFLNELQGFVSKSSINEGRKAVGGWTVNELANELAQSTEFNWRRRPGFYRAVCLEIQAHIPKRTVGREREE